LKPLHIAGMSRFEAVDLMLKHAARPECVHGLMRRVYVVTFYSETLLAQFTIILAA
jgi:hypothetical protein